MSTLRIGAACLALLLIGCDSVTLVPGTGDTFRTPGTDYPSAAVALSAGQIVVGALVEGTIAPTDGTIGFPAVVRFSGGGAEAAIYDDGERDYFGVEGVAPLSDGLAIAIGSNDGVRLYRTDRDGRDRRALAHIDDARFIPEGALHAAPGGLVLAVYANTADGAHLYGLSASGDVRWTYRLPEAQDIRAVSVAPGGDLFVAGPGRRGGEAIVARLSPDGGERWRTELADVTSPVDIAATEAGAVVLGQRADLLGAEVARLEGSGDVTWSRSLSEDRFARPTRVVLLGDGTVVAALTQDDGDFETGNVASLAVLDVGGEIRETIPLGDPTDATTFVQGLVALPDGRLGVVAAVGPNQLGGYGGDDFDIEVTRLSLPE